MTTIKLLALTSDLVEFGGWSIGRDDDGHYYVITPHDVRDIDVGDVICGDFEAFFYCSRSVYCVSKKKEVRITLEGSKVSLDEAVEHFLDSTGVPAQVFFMTRHLAIMDFHDRDHQFRDEIARS
jgi:hypothetical protein